MIGGMVGRGVGAPLLALAVCSAPELRAQSRPASVAILPFEDRGSYGQDREVFRALRLGIPATIASELGGHSELRLADPAQVTRALQTQGAGGRLDAASAAKVGKAAGARYAITGNFTDLYGRVRLDARIIDTESGQIVRVVSNDDPELAAREDLYRIIQTVGHKVLAAAGGTGRAPGLENRTIPTEALTQFSLGLLYEEEGDRTRAGQHYRRALARFGDYPEATEGLRRVGSP